MRSFRCKRIIYSSSAEVYGVKNKLEKISESRDSLKPVTDLGKMCLRMERVVYNWTLEEKTNSAIMMRNFKVVGTHPSGLIGLEESKKHCTLMSNILEVAYGEKEAVTIHGQGFHTTDGTAEHDFIHVVDLA